jgi:hypothetical protein
MMWTSLPVADLLAMSEGVCFHLTTSSLDGMLMREDCFHESASLSMAATFAIFGERLGENDCERHELT